MAQSITLYICVQALCGTHECWLSVVLRHICVVPESVWEWVFGLVDNALVTAECAARCLVV